MAAVALVSHSQFTVAHANPLGLLFLPVRLAPGRGYFLGGDRFRGFFGTRSTLVNLSVGFIDA